MGKKVKVVKSKCQADPVKISQKSKKISKTAEVTKETVVEEGATVMPTVDTDPVLKKITEKTKAVEKKETEKEKKKGKGEKKEVVEEKEEEEEVVEKVKVKRKESLIKKSSEKSPKSSSSTKGSSSTKSSSSTESSGEKTFMSLENPAEDNKQIKVPSYSYKKNRGIVYISHIPHGFFEAQMREFFSQFGTVTNLRLGRSKKTGKSRGFAFVEFKYSEVAKVVSETMNNYLMFNKIVKCELLPKERMSQKVFMGKINPARPPLLLSRRTAKKLHNAVKSAETEEKRLKRQGRSLAKVQKQLEAAGIQYSVNVS